MVLGKDLHEQMLFIRMLEEKIAEEYSKQEMRCPVHLSIGQEASAVGVASQLSTRDFMVSTHRSHAHYLAKGGSPYRLLCELYGRVDGCSRGQGGSMHLVDWSVGFAGSTSIVGGTIPIGVGLAFSSKFKQEDRVVAVCLGDAAIEEGVFHESANFASLHNLPVIFVIENNLYSCYTHISQRQPSRPLSEVARAHHLSFMQVDGNNVEAVSAATAQIVRHIHEGSGPWFLELMTYRLIEHCGPNQDDHLNYRHPDERIQFQDPIPLNRPGYLKNEIDRLFMRVKAAAYPDKNELGRYIYA